MPAGQDLDPPTCFLVAGMTYQHLTPAFLLRWRSFELFALAGLELQSSLSLSPGVAEISGVSHHTQLWYFILLLELENSVSHHELTWEAGFLRIVQ
jgi:hypothetical protein